MLRIADNRLQWICYCCTKMVFLKEDKILIKNLRELKGSTTSTSTICGDACPLSCASAEA